MTDDQYQGILGQMYAQQTDSDTLVAGVARMQSIDSALFVALAICIGFVIVFGLCILFQNRPRGA